MKVDIRIVNDSLTPAINKLIKESGALSKSVLKAMGVSLQSRIVRSFTDQGLRIETWKPKKDGTPTTLQRSTTLRSSIDLTECTDKHATVSTSTVYGQFHQFGTRKGLPRRPFFPFKKNGKIDEHHETALVKVGQSQLDAELKKTDKT